MYLKRLELLGFKSFADKVEIVFQPGVTAVVGPNGCGKSNIADALRWTLGEQSMRALRGMRMEDIIFAGSDTRKPLGLSEVELVLDNSDGALPVEFSEVSIARRLYRSGESEYLINKVPVRLRDVQEMFFDTGLGKEAYSVIGQGKIDAILSAKAEDRRAVFEEAAGVVKYKHRKAAAMRRLDETQANLVRVGDLLAEIESQLGPLHEQAILAERHQRLTSELTQLDINLTGRELAELTAGIDRAEADLARVRADEESLAREENVLDAGLEETRLAALARDEEVGREQQELFNLGNRIEQERGRLELVREKERSLGERTEGLAVRRSETANRLAQAQARRAEQLGTLEEVGRARAEIAAALAAAEDTIAQGDTDLRGLLGREDELKAEIIEDMNRVAAAKNGLQGVRVEREFLARARKELAAKEKILAGEAEAVEGRLAAARAEQNELAAADRAAAEAEEAAANDRRTLQSSLAGLEAKNQEWRERIKGIESRLGLLEEMERTYQGYFPGVRSILVEAGNEPFARHIKGLVAELIKVKPGFETALEVALGSALQFVVIEDDAQAQAAIAFLKRTGRGRATFLPLNMVRGNRATGSGLAEAMAACEAHHATDLLEYEAEYGGIMDHLLGGTLVAPTLAQAVALAKRTGKAFRIVTKEGEIINAGGAMTGGSLDKRKTQILGRKREIEELKREKDTALTFLAKGQSETERTRQELARIEAESAALSGRRRDLAQALAAAAKTVENFNSQVERLAEEIAVLKFQAVENEENVAALGTRTQELEAELATMETILVDHRRELTEITEQLKRRQSEKEAAVQILGDHRVALATKMEEEKQFREAVNAAERSAAEFTADLESLAAEEREIAAALVSLKEEEQRIQARLVELERAKTEADARLAAAAASRDEGQQTQKKTESRLRALRRERTRLGNEIHRLELSLGEWRVRAETHRDHLVREYGFEWEERFQSETEMNPEQAAARIESLRADIRDLGPVNPGAIDEYKAQMDRHDFLRRQSDDLIAAKASLERIITEIERTIKQRFAETFAAVREEFVGLFRQLFNGGKADLLLIDPDNPLESGIEVVAQPPGKRLQSLSLLSGGERAMTAIALLFSILRIKPAPFCILDEIDATLDEANVGRFAELLTTFSLGMQFIVITHRRGTMEVADALYGVTMEEMGVSKLISLQLKETEEKAG